MPALFDVPGWSVPSVPVSIQHHSKKRKRAASSEEQALLRTAQANLDKLVDSLGGSAAFGKDAGDGSSKKKRKRKLNKPTSQPSHCDQRGEDLHPPGKLHRQAKALVPSVDPPTASHKAALPRKKAKKKNAEPVVQPTNVSEHYAGVQDTDGLTPLQRSFKKTLDGARFRLLNETLYKSSSLEAVKMMKEDPTIFEDYHVGFRRQVQSWPSNPVSCYISELSSYPTKTVIADLGCGEAALARALLAKNLIVLSFDLVSDGAYVIEADICSQVPLPGSEPHSAESINGEAQIVDVVVCALSLMGTNWPKCATYEADRGELMIAEVASRFTSVDDFTSLINSIGFKLQKKVVIVMPSVPIGKRHILSHPVVNARLSQLRLATTSPKDFREGIHDISFTLGVEASRDLEEEPFDGVSAITATVSSLTYSMLKHTPVGPFTGTVIKPRIGLTPILRAGLGMADALLKLFPAAPVYHLGLFREKVSLQPVECAYYAMLSRVNAEAGSADYSKLPSVPPVDAVFLLDPLVATGGTACAALTMLLDWGIPLSKIKLLVVLGSEPGLSHIEASYPDLEIWVAAVDPNLTRDGLISPGLGDTGDRLFNTVQE
ncbi:putative uracil phosphoribosyltransferase [Lanmaoa asiatica]|nr:putative uracil phosphoribosyltransferase [Lanmaoa asiatica]